VLAVGICCNQNCELHNVKLGNGPKFWRRLFILLDHFRGNGASVLRIVPYAGLQFMGYEQYRRWMIEWYPPAAKGPLVDLVAGSLAGGTAVLLTYPLDLARTRLAYNVS
jgi:hypothetical protein